MGRLGEAPYTDLMAATDAAIADPRVDGARTAVMGGSFGGYMANWIAGHTDRFDAIVTHASLWALDQFGGTTDGAYWWAREMTPDMAERNSPHRFVEHIATPMLVIHGDKDYRVPIGEGLRLWYELLTKSRLPADDAGDGPHRFLYFPSENHWVLAPSTPSSGTRWSSPSWPATCSATTSRCPNCSGSVGTMSPAAQREFDIVVYGATGFVGKLTADYLARHGGDARIALAGRSQEKLLKVRETLGDRAADWELITADASQPSTLEKMAARTRVVVTTVGPYTKYGLPLVAACAAAGTDYADLTGETMFIRDSIDHYHKQAVDTGARIVHACGFDSIPSDLTVYALYRTVTEDGEGELGDTSMVVRTFAGGASGGTLASIMEVLNTASTDPEARRQMTDPYTLSPDRSAEPELGAQPDMRWRRGGEIAPELEGYWTAAFAMAGPNTRIVRRSNALLGYAYGRKLEYSEVMSTGRTPSHPPSPR